MVLPHCTHGNKRPPNPFWETIQKWAGKDWVSSNTLLLKLSTKNESITNNDNSSIKNTNNHGNDFNFTNDDSKDDITKWRN